MPWYLVLVSFLVRLGLSAGLSAILRVIPFCQIRGVGKVDGVARLSPGVRPDHGDVRQEDRPDDEQPLDGPRNVQHHREDEADDADAHLGEIAHFPAPDVGGQGRPRVGDLMYDSTATPKLHPSTVVPPERESLHP